MLAQARVREVSRIFAMREVSKGKDNHGNFAH